MIIDLDTSLEELNRMGRLSARAYNCLFAGEYKTLRDVFECVKPISELKKMRNMGKKTYEEIVALLSEVSTNHHVSLDQFSLQLMESLDGIAGKLLQDAYESLFQNQTNVSCYFQSIYPDLRSLHKAVLEEDTSLLLLNEQFSYAQNRELRGMTVSYLNQAMERMQQHGLEAKQVYAIYRLKRNFLSIHADFTEVEKLQYFFSPIQRVCLVNKYEDLKKGLSSRARNFLVANGQTLEDMVELIGADKAAFAHLQEYITQKTAHELYAFTERLKEEFNRYWSLDEEGCQLEIVRYRFPYFDEPKWTFIHRHYIRHGFYPRFFILYHYLRQSTSRREQVYSWLFGIHDGESHSMIEMANRFQLSRERIRQLADSRLDVCDTEIIRSDEWRHYEGLLALPYITHHSPEWVAMKSREELPVSFEVFFALIKILGERYAEGKPIKQNLGMRYSVAFQYELVHLCGLELILNRKAFPSWDYRQGIQDLERLLSQTHAKDTVLSIDEFLKGTSGEEKEAAASLVGYLAVEGLHLSVDAKGHIQVPRNYFDVSEELYHLLEDQGSPMSAQALFDRYNAVYPDHTLPSVKHLKDYLFANVHINFIGKSGLYGLDSWEQVFFGSIRDALIEQLRASDKPVHIDKLMKRVLIHYPKTNAKSVRRSMEGDHLKRFVKFQNGYYGLTEKTYSEEFQPHVFINRDQDFCNRLAEFKEFVETNQHFPLASGDVNEQSLYVWYMKIANTYESVPNEHKRLLDETIRDYTGRLIPRKKTEVHFKALCDRFVDHVQKEGQLPNRETDPTLANWFKQAQRAYGGFKDFRKRYFSDLLGRLKILRIITQR